jgi:hypothetical protein
VLDLRRARIGSPRAGRWNLRIKLVDPATMPDQRDRWAKIYETLFVNAALCNKAVAAAMSMRDLPGKSLMHSSQRSAR